METTRVDVLNNFDAQKVDERAARGYCCGGKELRVAFRRMRRM
jgi:hypothetical protein